MELPTVQHYLHLLSVCLDPSPSWIYDRDARLDTLNGATRATLGGFKPVYAEHRLAWLPAPPSRLKPRYGASALHIDLRLMPGMKCLTA